MQKSESLSNLAKALASFQKDVKNPANTASNPFYKSKYAPLPDILNDVRPLLAKYGLSVLQAPSGDGEKIIITTLLMHESGEWIETCPLVLKAEKITAQGAGSAITYGRRYALTAVLGISSEDDDDGNHAEKPVHSTKEQKQQMPKEQPKKQEQTQSASQPVDWSKFWVRCNNLGFSKEEVHSFAGVESISHYTREQAMELFKRLEAVRQEEKASA